MNPPRAHSRAQGGLALPPAADRQYPTIAYRCADCGAEFDTGEINRKPARDALAREGWTTDREPMPPGMLGMFRHHCDECTRRGKNIAHLHRVLDPATAARAYGCEAACDGAMPSARATHERNPALHRVSALRVGIAIAVTYALIVDALAVTP